MSRGIDVTCFMLLVLNSNKEGALRARILQKIELIETRKIFQKLEYLESEDFSPNLQNLW